MDLSNVGLWPGTLYHPKTAYFAPSYLEKPEQTWKTEAWGGCRKESRAQQGWSCLRSHPSPVDGLQVWVLWFSWKNERVLPVKWQKSSSGDFQAMDRITPQCRPQVPILVQEDLHVSGLALKPGGPQPQLFPKWAWGHMQQQSNPCLLPSEKA